MRLRLCFTVAVASILVVYLAGFVWLYSSSTKPVFYQDLPEPDILRMCSCESPIISHIAMKDRPSTCGLRSQSRGAGQKVVSFSLFGAYLGDDDRLPNWYAQGAVANARLVPDFFGDDWLMRIYHDEAGFNAERMDFLCQLSCNHSHVDLCYVGQLPYFEDVEDYPGTLWRFLPMADPFVDIFHVRDLDSRPSKREISALNEFHSSPEQYHILRDHRNHRAPILAGMWGGKPSVDRKSSRHLMHRMLFKGKSLRKSFADKTFDQLILAQVLFPAIKDVAMAHDSYHCGFNRVHSVRPFPTARPMEPYNFVGSQMFGHAKPYRDVCPPPCRPRQHMDWQYC